MLKYIIYSHEASKTLPLGFFYITLHFTLHLHYNILQYIILLFSKHLNIIIKLGILKLTDEGGALTLTEVSVALTRVCPIFFL